MTYRSGILTAAATLLLMHLAATTSHAGEIHLLNGDRLSGTIIERKVRVIVLEHNAFGRMEIPIAAIAYVRTDKVLLPVTPEAPPVETVPLDQPDADPTDLEEPDAPRPMPEPPDAEWQSQLEVGLTGTEGTSRTSRLRAAFRSTRTAPDHLFRYDASYRFGATGGERTENQFTTGVFSEWPRPDSPWSTFGQGRYDYSEFQSWEHRLTAGAGIGYRLLDLKKHTDEGKEIDLLRLKLRGGAGVRKEFGSADEEFDPEGIAGVEIMWRMNDYMRLEAGSTAFPSLDKRGELRVVSSIDWIIDVDWMRGMALKLGAAHEYDSQPDSGISPNDLSVYATFLLNF